MSIAFRKSTIALLAVLISSAALLIAVRLDFSLLPGRSTGPLHQAAPNSSGTTSNEPSGTNELARLDDVTLSHIKSFISDVAIKPEENNLKHAIHLDHKVGRPFISQGDYRSAYDTYKKVIAISYNNNSLLGIGIGMLMISSTLEHLGEPEQALKIAYLTHNVSTALNTRAETGVSELYIARLLKNDSPGLATKWALRARDSLQGSRYKEDLVQLHTLLGDLLVSQGNIDQARQNYEQGWQLSSSLGQSPQAKWAKQDSGRALARLYNRLKLHEEALITLESTLSTFSPPDKRSRYYASMLAYLGDTFSYLNETDSARNVYLKAITHYEIARATAGADRARAVLDRSFYSLVDEVVKINLQENDLAGAVAILESNKGRTLSDVLESRIVPEHRNTYLELKQRHLKELEDIFKPKDPLNPYSSTAAVSKYWNTVTRQEAELQNLRTSSGLINIPSSPVLAPENVLALKDSLPDDTALVSLFWSTDNVDVFIIHKNGLLHHRPPLTIKVLQQYASQLNLALSNPFTDFYLEPARKLYSSLLKPVLHRLPGKVKRLVISPDGHLSEIPFDVLMNGSQHLIESFSVYMVPGLRFYSYSNQKPFPSSGIACVDPELPGTGLPFQRETGETLSTLFKNSLTLLTGNGCGIQQLGAAIKDQTRPYFIHIGAHGHHSRTDPMSSYIALSADSNNGFGILDVNTISSLDLSNNILVTLSSCKTGAADPDYRRDPFGIIRAFMYAGTDAVISPLWNVHDRATSMLMTNFYSSLSHNNQIDIALAEAKRAQIKHSRFSHPHYWAGFYLSMVQK